MAYPESLSFSRKSTYERCRKQHYYKYIEKIKPLPTDMPVEVFARFTTGSAIHAVLESMLRGNAPTHGFTALRNRVEKDGANDEKRMLLPDIERDALVIAQEVADFLPLRDFEPVMWEGKPMIEFNLNAALPGFEGGYFGVVDLVAKHKPTGRVYLIDWKPKASFSGEDSEKYDTQQPYYLHALAKMGLQVHGAAIVEVKSTVAKRGPRYKRTDTQSLDSVRESESGRVRWTPTYRSPAFVEAVWQDLEKEAQYIWDTQRDPDKNFRSMSAWVCKTCSFARICMAELNDEDLDHVMESKFSVEITE